MGEIRITSPHLRVVRAEGEPLEVQTANPDLILWDMTRTKHRWPNVTDAPFLWLTFIAWAGARRTGVIEPDHTWERWRDEVLDVTDLNENGAGPEGDEGTPTLPGPGPG